MAHQPPTDIRTTRRPFLKLAASAALATTLTVASISALAQQTISLLNVSYDPTRELYRELTKAFNDSRAKAGLPGSGERYAVPTMGEVRVPGLDARSSALAAAAAAATADADGAGAAAGAGAGA